jgi:triacylglycerol lipase
MNIVLLHGVLGFGTRFGVDYFNGVADHLLKTFPGAAVLTTEVDPLGEVRDRAQQAAKQIANPPSSVAFDPHKPIHLIAHSMGGLDARLLVAKNFENLRDRIRTVICLGTPHLGSPVATLLDHANPLQLPFLAHLDLSFVNELRSRKNALHDLSEKVAADFNNEAADVPAVHYFDVAGVGRNAIFPTSAPFIPTSAILIGAGRNDGVVPFISATRRRHPAAIWPADHADMVGHDLNGGATGRPAFDYLTAYDDLVRRLVLLNQ